MSQTGNYECKVEDQILYKEQRIFSNCAQNQERYDQQSSLNQGKWSDEENLRFTIFITVNKQIFRSKAKRKQIQIFKDLSDFISTRSPRQCRSHFQKAIKKFSTIAKMKSFYRKLVGLNEFETKMNKYLPHIQIFKGLKKKNSKDVERVEAEIQTDPILIYPAYGYQYKWAQTYPTLIPNLLIQCLANFQ